MSKAERVLPESRYDLSTYSGRVKHTIQITDPRTLLTTSRQLDQARELLTRYRRHEIDLDEVVWRAKKQIDASVHPETGKPIFLPFRMSSFVLTNLVVTAGMLTPNLGLRGTVAWQIINQTVNVAFNYANANKSSPLTPTQLSTSYLSAVGASCGVAIGLNQLVRHIRAPGRRELAGRLIPFVAVASAGALNVLLMRYGELQTGIDVFPDASSGSGSGSGSSRPTTTTTEESLGKSKVAAWKAISETAASRVLNSSPIMIIPPLILLTLQRKTSLLNRHPKLTLPINLLSIFVTSLVALPLAIATFPTREHLASKDLDEGLRGSVMDRGITRVVFNRGM